MSICRWKGRIVIEGVVNVPPKTMVLAKFSLNFMGLAIFGGYVCLVVSIFLSGRRDFLQG